MTMKISTLVFSYLLFFVNGLDISGNLLKHLGRDSGPIVCRIECPTLKTDTSCKENEEYSTIPFCDKTCDNPDNQNCYFLLPSGCKCKDGFYRTKDGKCVPAQSCQVSPIPTQPSKSADVCGLNEIFTYQHTLLCEPSCHNPNPGLCPKFAGLPGCICKDGYVRNGQGACVTPWLCYSYYPSTPSYLSNRPYPSFPFYAPLKNSYKGINAGSLGNLGSLNLNVGAPF